MYTAGGNVKLQMTLVKRRPRAQTKPSKIWVNFPTFKDVKIERLVNPWP